MKINTTKRPYVSPRMACVALATESDMLSASSPEVKDEVGDDDEYVREERPLQWKSTVWD